MGFIIVALVLCWFGLFFWAVKTDIKNRKKFKKGLDKSKKMCYNKYVR